MNTNAFKQLLRTIENKTTLEILNVSNQDLDLNQIKLLIAALNQNSYITSLNLEGNSINADGAIEIAKSTTLKTLNLSNNDIGASGAAALSQNKIFTTLDLESNNLGDAGAEEIANSTTLTTVNLGNNNIGNAGAIKLFGNKKFISLNLSNNRISVIGLAALAENTSLTTIQLCQNDISDAEAIALSDYSKLSDIDLQYNFVSDNGATALAKNKHIRNLNLRNNQIGDPGAIALSTSKTLVTLNLESNKIANNGARALFKHLGLTNLNLSNNSIGDDAVKILASNKILVKLNLAHNKISTAGAKELAKNKSIIILNLTDNDIGDDGVAALSLNTIIQSLNLTNTQLTLKGAKKLLTNNTLTSLKLQCNDITQENLRLLDQHVRYNLEQRNLQLRMFAVIQDADNKSDNSQSINSIETENTSINSSSQLQIIQSFGYPAKLKNSPSQTEKSLLLVDELSESLISTPEDGNDVFHVILGKFTKDTKRIMCKNVSDHRKQIASKIIELQSNAEIFARIKDAIQFIILRDEQIGPEIDKLKVTYQTNQSSTFFDEYLSKNLQVITEYAHLIIGTAGRQLQPGEVAIIAHVLNITISIYKNDQEIEDVQTYNPEGFPLIKIYFDEKNYKWICDPIVDGELEEIRQLVKKGSFNLYHSGNINETINCYEQVFSMLRKNHTLCCLLENLEDSYTAILHDLACCYFARQSENDIKRADYLFNIAIRDGKANTTAEYGNFLYMQAMCQPTQRNDYLNRAIKQFVFAILSDEFKETLTYNELAIRTIDESLQSLVTKKKVIKLHAKVLAYYLLIKSYCILENSNKATQTLYEFEEYLDYIFSLDEKTYDDLFLLTQVKQLMIVNDQVNIPAVYDSANFINNHSFNKLKQLENLPFSDMTDIYCRYLEKLCKQDTLFISNEQFKSIKYSLDRVKRLLKPNDISLYVKIIAKIMNLLYKSLRKTPQYSIYSLYVSKTGNCLSKIYKSKRHFGDTYINFFKDFSENGMAITMGIEVIDNYIEFAQTLYNDNEDLLQISGGKFLIKQLYQNFSMLLYYSYKHEVLCQADKYWQIMTNIGLNLNNSAAFTFNLKCDDVFSTIYNGLNQESRYFRLQVLRKNLESLTISAKIINEQFNDSDLPMHYALNLGIEQLHREYEVLEIIKILHAKGGDLTLVNKQGNTLLAMAASFGYVNVCKYLLDNKVNINQKCTNGDLPILLAYLNQHLEVINLLQAQGALLSLDDVNATDENGYTLLMNMAITNNSAFAKRVLSVDKTLVNFSHHESGNTALSYAVKNNAFGVVQELVQSKKADINFKNKMALSPIMLACAHGNHAVAKYLYENGADISVDELIRACSSGQLTLAKDLVELGMDINSYSNNKTAIMSASACGHLEIVKFLLQKGAKTPFNIGRNILLHTMVIAMINTPQQAKSFFESHYFNEHDLLAAQKQKLAELIAASRVAPTEKIYSDIIKVAVFHKRDEYMNDCLWQSLKSLGKLYEKLADDEVSISIKQYLLVKSAALYNCAINIQFMSQVNVQAIRYPRELQDTICPIEMKITNGKRINTCYPVQDILINRCVLQTIRQHLTTELNNYSYIEAINNIQNIYQTSNVKLRWFIIWVWEKCMQTLGSPPYECQYSIIIFGSISRCEGTPYSDLEWGILIDKDNKDLKEYFRQLSNLLFFHIVNLGETQLHQLNLPELQDIDDPYTPRGFAFDGQHSRAGRTPFGKKTICTGHLRQEAGYELLGTPEEVVKLQTAEWHRKDKLLPSEIAHFSHLCGSNELTNKYRQLLKQAEPNVTSFNLCIEQMHLQQTSTGSQLDLCTERQKRTLVLMANDANCDRDCFTFIATFNLKTMWYRPINTIISNLTDLFNLETESTFDGIKRLKNAKIFTDAASHELMRTFESILLIRMKLYCKYKAHKNSFLINHEPNLTIPSVVAELLNINDEQALDLVLQIYKAIYFLTKIAHNIHWFANDLESLNSRLFNLNYGCSEYDAGLFYKAHHAYEKAIECFIQSSKAQPENLATYYELAHMYLLLDRKIDALNAFEQLFVLQKKFKLKSDNLGIYKDDFSYHNITLDDTEFESMRTTYFNLYGDIHNTIYLDVPITLPDGNCAFNSLALGICALAEQGKLTAVMPIVYKQLRIDLRLPTATCEAFCCWLREHKDPKYRQQLLQESLRSIAINFIEQHYLSIYKTSYEEQLWDAYENKEHSIDDTFVVHPHIASKFKEKKLTKANLLEWWEQTGKITYFNDIRLPATNASDKKSWGSEPEIDALATVFGINVKWIKQQGYHRVGVGNGLITNLNQDEINLLQAIGIGRQFGPWFKFEDFAILDMLLQKIQPIEAHKEELLAHLNFPVTTELPPFIDKDQVYKQQLKDRGVITDNDRFISADGYGQIDTNRILVLVDGISAPTLINKILVAYKPIEDQVVLKFSGMHWQYMGIANKQQTKQRSIRNSSDEHSAELTPQTQPAILTAYSNAQAALSSPGVTILCEGANVPTDNNMPKERNVCGANI